jgi:parvulin-like peptidyl-prolyl isomerase
MTSAPSIEHIAARTRPVRTPLRLTCRVAAVVTASVLVGCGSTQNGQLSPAGSARGLPRAPGGVLARVGSDEIDQAAYDRQFSAEAEREESSTQAIPVPPRFELCVKRLQAAARGLGIAMPTRSLFQAKCQARYEALRERALDRLLVGRWIVGEAADLGLTVGPAQAQQAVSRAIKARFSSETQFKDYLAQTWLNRADLVSEARVALLARLIRHRITRGLGAFSRARIKAYYESHPSLDATPETRDLEIVRAGSVAAATKIKREIAAGRSFASAANALPHQPAESKDGFKAHYEHHAFREPKLDTAVFAAKPDVLYGPVALSIGFYVFRVTHVYPSRQRPFQEVERSVVRTLPRRLTQQVLSRFTTSWTQRWKARTDCASGYRVPLCSQAKASSTRASIEAPGAFE